MRRTATIIASIAAVAAALGALHGGLEGAVAAVMIVLVGAVQVRAAMASMRMMGGSATRRDPWWMAAGALVLLAWQRGWI